MKKITALVVTICMLITMAVPVSAVEHDTYDRHAGEEIRIDIGEFRDREHDADPGYSLSKENYGLGYRFTSGGANFVSAVYMDESTQDVVIELKGGSALSKDKKFSGTITLKDLEPKGFRYYYELDVNMASMNAEYMREYDGRSTYTLPWNYQSCLIRFRDSSDTDSEKQKYRFFADFDSKATFETNLMEQDNLYLGYSTTWNSSLVNKYKDADMRFIQWNDNPKFDFVGSLIIKARKDEYVYRILSDGTLQKFGTYDSSALGYTGKTDTLGSYVISDIPLNAAAASTEPAQSEQSTTGDYTGKNPNTGR